MDLSFPRKHLAKISPHQILASSCRNVVFPCGSRPSWWFLFIFLTCKFHPAIRCFLTGLCWAGERYMAEAVVTFLVGKLGDLLATQVSLIRGVDGEIRILHDKLQWLRAFLRDADAKREDNERINVWVSQIRDVAYQAEDAVDRYMYELQRRRPADSMSCLQNCVASISHLKVRHDLGHQIKEIKRRLQEISDCKSQLGIELIQTREEASSSSSGLQERHNRDMPTVEEVNVVGFQGDAATVKEKLIRGDLRRAAVSIVGMGGLGKTTLARKVYNSSDVKAHFDCHAWVHVSQKYRRRDLLQSIIGAFANLGGKEAAEMTADDMANRLRQHLQGRRYLLVIDDIWEVGAWNNICSALPDGLMGSRILLTSRNKDVGQYVDPGGFMHEPECLTKEESWKLFCSKAFRNKDGCPSELEDMGMKMLEKCAGLPLAIIVLAGLLQRKPQTETEWRRVLKRTTYELNEKSGGENVRKILALSYDDLPHYLKSCFLYFGLFPEDYEIDAEELIRLWIAEGFIQSREEQTMEEVAEDYLEELVNRCMIQVVRQNTRGCILKCRIHDLLHSLSVSEGIEDKYLSTWTRDPIITLSAASRRLAIHGNSTDGNEIISRSTQPASSLRSLLCFSMEREQSLSLIHNLMNSNLKLLRVLDLGGAPFKRLPKQIGEMIHLRYIGLRGTMVKKLPSSIGKLSNLQTLRLALGCCVPEVVWKIETLRHVEGPKLETSSIHCHCRSNLQTLHGIRAGAWLQRALGELTNIRRLRLWDISPPHMPGLLESLPRLTCLNILVLEMECSPTLAATVLSALADHPVLYTLVFHVGTRVSDQEEMHHQGEEQLPSYGDLRWAACLSEIYLSGTLFSKLEHLALLQRLPRLKILKLDGDAYVGKEMVCSTGGFPQLHELVLLTLLDLERWTIEGGAMPRLRRLWIHGCERLEMIPDGLRHVTTLQELELLHMPQDFLRRVRKEEGEDWRKIQHIPSIKLKF